MGAGGSKKLDVHPSDRRRSHIDTNPPPQSEVLVECNFCGRTFAEDRIARHMEVCEKMQDRKRDVYNIAERRGGTLNVDDDDKPKFDWKQTRTDLLEQLKEAKKSRPRSASGLDPPVEMYGVNLEEED